MSLPPTPALDADKARYLTEGLETVQGWLHPSTALYLAGLETLTRGEVEGGVCEIGVHMGKSFMAMVLDQPAGEPAVAIDLFDLQHLNEDGTSVRAKALFEQHLTDWGVRDRVEVVEGSSLDLEEQGFLDGGRRFRLFSVDGGHNAPYVLNDMRLAEATLTEGGIVALDDIFNQHWLGVVTGFFDYLSTGGSLVPFALVPNKLLLTDAGSADKHRKIMKEAFGAACTKSDIPFVGHAIDRYEDIAWSVLGPDGERGPLQRPDNAAANAVAELTGLRLENTTLKQELRRARSHVTDLRKKNAETDRSLSRAKEQQARAEAERKAVLKSRPKGSPVPGPLRAVGRRLPAPVQARAKDAWRALSAARGR